MIFVVLGTQKFQLNRLLIEIDRLIENGMLTEPVFAQIGYSTYMPTNYQFVDFCSQNEFENCVRKADLIIIHAGIGTIVEGLKNKKPIVVFPRLKKFKEHVDNHQLEIAEAFAQSNFVISCENQEDLLNIIVKAKTHIFCEYVSQKNQIVDCIDDFLKTIYE